MFEDLIKNRQTVRIHYADGNCITGLIIGFNDASFLLNPNIVVPQKSVLKVEVITFEHQLNLTETMQPSVHSSFRKRSLKVNFQPTGIK